jgi:hypothetical protein
MMDSSAANRNPLDSPIELHVHRPWEGRGRRGAWTLELADFRRDQVAADRQRHLQGGGPTPRHHRPVRTNDVRPIGRLSASLQHRDVFVDIEIDCGRPDETRRGIHSHPWTPRLISGIEAWAPDAMGMDIVPESLNRRIRRTPAPAERARDPAHQRPQEQPPHRRRV